MSEIIFGRNAIIEAIKQKRKFEKLFITDGNKDIVKLAKDNNLKYEIVNKEFISSKANYSS